MIKKTLTLFDPPILRLRICPADILGQKDITSRIIVVILFELAKQWTSFMSIGRKLVKINDI